MVQAAVTRNVTTLKQAEDAFNLARTSDPAFFREWQSGLLELTASEKASLDRVRGRFRYALGNGDLAESVVNLMVLSPLLELAGFYDPPFRLRGEMLVDVETVTPVDETDNRVLRGRIDFFVLMDRLWLAVMESKGTEINLEKAIPQALSYMMASPAEEQDIYGMVTNGGQFFFLKLCRAGAPEYDVSRVFSLLPLQNELYGVLQILKRLGNALN